MSSKQISFTHTSEVAPSMNPHDNDDIDEDDLQQALTSTPASPQGVTRSVNIDPNDEEAMRRSLAREVISRSENKTMIFDGFRQEDRVSMTPNEVTERFLAIVKKRQGEQAAQLLAQAIIEEKRALADTPKSNTPKSNAADANGLANDLWAKSGPQPRESNPARVQRKSNQERTAPAPIPMVAPELGKSALPLNGAATADVRKSIFAQADKKQRKETSGVQRTPSPTAPTRLGIDPDSNPKAAQSLQQLSTPIARPRP